MVAGGAQCTLTRAIALHATHHFAAGGVAQPHGHLYRVEVTVAGTLAPGESALIDLSLLDRVLTEEVADRWAGRDLNVVFSDTASLRQPTCEALAAWCWHRITPRLPADVRLARVRVMEDATLWGECSGAG